jgi:PAS domain-containing protein
VLDTIPRTAARRVARTPVRPTGEERSFSAEELIVSETDPRGVITDANDVFLRMGAYSLDEVIGQPHNLIRRAGEDPLTSTARPPAPGYCRGRGPGASGGLPARACTVTDSEVVAPAAAS